MRFAGEAAVVALTVLALTGCGSQATRLPTTPTVTVAPSSAAPDPTSSPTMPDAVVASPDPQGPTAAADPNRPKNQCPDADIGVAIVAVGGGGSAGTKHFQVLFTNTGGTACELLGAPRISVVGDGDGTLLGKPADRVQTGATTLTIDAGATFAAPLAVVNIGTNGGPLVGCVVRKGDGYRVVAPHSTHAIFVKDPAAVACVSGPSFMTVGPVAQRTD